MNRSYLKQALLVSTLLVNTISPQVFTQGRAEMPDPVQAQKNDSPSRAYEAKRVAGWTVQVDRRLLDAQSAKTMQALRLLKKQLEEIEKVVPQPALGQLQQVTLWFSPEYPQTQPRAEYHPGEAWLRDNGRNPAMVKGIEFTNIGIFEAEMRRMPNFALHELAHAYHHRFLPGDFSNQEIDNMYQRAKAGGKYEQVARRDTNGRTTKDRAYAMTNPQEYFAECTEAFFSSNDFYPFNRAQLEQHDPAMAALLQKLWGLK